MYVIEKCGCQVNCMQENRFPRHLVIFSSVYGEKYKYVISDLDDDSLFTAQNLNITLIIKSEVKSAIKKLKPKQFCRLDGIAQYRIKECEDILGVHLFHIFDLLIESRSFPERWKNYISNYRLVSIINALPKLFERILQSYI